jgi:nucleoid DNA-binding protein
MWALAGFLATLGVVGGVATTLAQPQPLRPVERLSLKAAVAKKTKLDEDDVAKVLEALGPIIRDKLANGETIDLPNFGTVRVVRIPEHKDMVKGRPATIAAINNVELVPSDDLVAASNSPNAVPAVTVPIFEFNPLPDQTKGQRIPGTRMPTIRQP